MPESYCYRDLNSYYTLEFADAIFSPNLRIPKSKVYDQNFAD